MPNADPKDFLPFIEEMARAAGEIHARHFRKLESYDNKSSIDLVTVADRESEALIKERIQRAYPTHALLLEESGAVAGAPDPPYTWVVDPLDGTTNFAHGNRLFCVSIAVVDRAGAPVAGGIYAALLDEYFHAARGHGAYRNGERLSVSKNAPLARALLVTGFPYDRAKVIDPLMAMMRAALLNSQGVLRLGAAALDFAYVAAGNIDCFYEYHHMPWDAAAGILLVTEAGGTVSDFRGGPFDTLKPVTSVASNGLIHDEVLEKIVRPHVDALDAARGSAR